MSNIIQQLKDKDLNNVYPVTSTSALYDSSSGEVFDAINYLKGQKAKDTEAEFNTNISYPTTAGTAIDIINDTISVKISNDASNAITLDPSGNLYVSDLSNMATDFHAMNAMVTGNYELPYFNAERNYLVGDLTVYQNACYVFRQQHNAGAWNPADVSTTSLLELYNELYNYSDRETIQVKVIKQTSLTTKSNYSGCTVIMTLENGTVQQATTGSDGTCVFNVSNGMGYTLSCPIADGFVAPASQNYIAKLKSRYVVFTYVSRSISGNFYNSTNVSIVANDYTVYKPNEWDTSKTCVGFVFHSPTLRDKDAMFMVKSDDIVVQNSDMTYSLRNFGNTSDAGRGRAWYSSYNNGTIQPTDVSTTNQTTAQTLMYDGSLYTTRIIETLPSGYSAPAASFARAQELVVNGTSHGYGYLGGPSQWYQVITSCSSDIQQCVLAVFGVTFNVNGILLWTSCQYNATDAWFTNGASLNYSGSNKTYSYGVVPFFAVPSQVLENLALAT